MDAHALDHQQVRRAREALLSAGLRAAPEARPSLRDEIDRSWRRSIGVGASPSGALRYVNEFDRDSELSRAARPVLDRLQDTLHDMGVAVFLSDARGQIVARRASSQCDLARLDSACAAEGFDFSEESIGTNGLGTAMNEPAAVFVRGPEHFNDALEGLACAGMGIRHPATGRIVGSLSLASSVESAELLMLAITREATQQIVQNLGDALSRRDLALTATYRRHRRRGPVIVLNRDTVMTNVAGLPFISPEGHAQLWEKLLGLDWCGTPQRIRLDLSVLDGPVLAHRIEEFADDPAFAVEVPETRRAAGPGTAGSPVQLHARPALSTAGPVERGTAAQARAQADLERSWRSSRGLLLLTGPSGAGKTFTARSWLRGEAAAAPEVLDVAALVDPARWADAVDAALAAGRPLLLRRAEDLQPQQFHRFQDLAAHLRADELQASSGTPGAPTPRVVVTADRSRCPADVLDLLVHLTTESALPGLAAAPDSVPELVTALCGAMEPLRRPVLSAAAMQALLRWHWPGNVTELRSTLHRLADERPGQVVRPEHLPEHLRLAQRRRRLSRIEAAERAEIVAALNQARGNRSLAAELLGIGRTTLYRKLGTLGIATTDDLAV